LIPAGSSLAGDWAPFFTLGADIDALVMNSVHNRPSRFSDSRPDYLLYCETFDVEQVMDELADVDTVTLGPPLYESAYKGRKVILYRLYYASKNKVRS
jgi:hypothetical protein